MVGVRPQLHYSSVQSLAKLFSFSDKQSGPEHDNIIYTTVLCKGNANNFCFDLLHVTLQAHSMFSYQTDRYLLAHEKLPVFLIVLGV